MSQVQSIQLEHYGLIQFSGAHVDKFLQGQLTCDVRQVNETTSIYGAYCTIKGRVQAIFRLFMLNGHYCLRLTKAVIPQIIQELSLYAKFSKIQVIDISEQYTLYGLVSSSSSFSFQNAFTINHTPHHIHEYSGHMIIPIDNTHFCFEYYQPKEDSPIFGSESNHSLDLNQWHTMQIQAGLADIFPETYEKFLPHHLNLTEIGAISFTKGCYRGQEIIARMQHRGTVKRHTYHFWCQNKAVSAPPGTPVSCSVLKYDNPGVIVQSAVSDRGLECLVETLDSLVDSNPILWLENPENALIRSS